MAIGNKHVQPAVVVVVKKPSSETKHRKSGTSDAGLCTHVPKTAFTVVMKDVIRRLLKIRNEQIKPAIVIVIAQRNAHRCHSVAETRQAHSRGHPDFAEFSVVIVEQVGGQPVIGYEQVWPAVVVVVGGAHGEVLALWFRNS